MAAPSIAALYPNPDAPSSAKKRDFTYDELLRIVRHSFAEAAIKRGTLNALTARGSWPGKDGPAHGVICVAFDGMALGDENGDGACSRRTAQRRAELACKKGYWRRTHKYNRWLPCPQCGAEREKAQCPKCSHKGRSLNRDGSTNTKEFCRPYTFEIDVDKFLTAPPPKCVRHFCARTWKEHKAAAKRGEHPNVTEMPRQSPAGDPPPKSPAPARPQEPVRKTAEHQRQERRMQPKLSKTESAKFVADMTILMRGYTHHTEVVGGYSFRLDPSDRRYRAPISQKEAILAVCERWKRAPDAVLEALKFWGYALQPDVS